MRRFFSDTVRFISSEERELPEYVQFMSEYDFHIGYDTSGEPQMRSADKEVFESFIKNFKNNAKGTKLLLDYGHKAYDEASAEVLDIKIEKGDDGKYNLFIKPKWTKKAKESILDGEWHYLSTEFSFEYPDPETGKDIGPCLIGGGLTNRPRIKNMKEVYKFSEEFKGIIMSEKEKMAKLEEENKKLKEKMAAMEKEKKEKKNSETPPADPPVEKNSDQSQRIEELETKLALSEKMKEVNKLYDEGKLLPEQLKLAEEAKSPAELETIIKFAEKAAPIKTDTISNNEEPMTSTDNSEYEKFSESLEKGVSDGQSLQEAALAAYKNCDSSKFEDSSIAGNAEDFMPEAHKRA